ncbi:16S rRNA (cytidine(1402)-2'-O)-methyltransferase [Eupransor demetentiae]|uniref:Ribosomal RNA small subunit methyltransferase I n=1 Tax=Eupransor demetentiae TaxID=3109584 RepID=A0ABM9N619_9LACO|nr:16S rRNA C1402 (ribose-2'-O) methylase RsmI (RsmI) [Lactobacillaceae bacterium LMG 33000]
MQIQKSFQKHDTGTLYLVPTPIGNLQDMSNRALETLQEVDLIAAEDTRHTAQLLNYFDIDTKQISFHEHNWQTRVPELIQMLEEGTTIGQVSDAGLPSISDPGQQLVEAAVAAGIPVVPIPGASAGITALIASGLVPQPFYFHGFLPRKKSEQIEELEALRPRQETVIIYEAPHRLKSTLSNLVTVMGPARPVVLARELTKRYEEFLRGSAQELADWSRNNEIRGEFVVMIGGATPDEIAEEVAEADEEELPVREAVQALVDQGLKPNPAIKQIAKERGIARQEVYRIYHQIEEED